MNSGPKGRTQDIAQLPIRERILSAAFEAFTEHGYAQASTLQIASRARVSKRELYALVGNKQEMLVACIGDRVKRMQMPSDLPALRDREGLGAVLTDFGSLLLRELTDPDVIAMHRLAIAEAERSPEVARALETFGRQPIRALLKNLFAQAQSAGLLDDTDPALMAAQFMALLWKDLTIGLLLRVTDRPAPTEARRRAREAASALLRLHPTPSFPLPPARED
jgi:AcrR family transcriptional regulator